MPGRTPIRVPTMAPMKAYMRLMGVSATPNPRARWLTRSMNRCSVGPGPERELEIEAEYEDTGSERSKKNSADQGFLRPKLRTRRARRKDQPDGRQHQTEMGYDQAEGDDATEQDRKSTRLNSSHSQISYAVFCLKKKKVTTNDDE